VTERPNHTFFRSRQEWRAWLEVNHASCSEIWIQYFKRHTGKETIVYKEALEEALCFGWIDGMVKRIDDDRYIQRFTPRRSRSNWSEVNIRLALKLLQEGKMNPAGLKFRDQWIPTTAEKVSRKLIHADVNEWEEALIHYPIAAANFNKLPPSHKKQYMLWIMDAKRPETRLKRISEAIAVLEKGEKLGMK